MVEEYIEIMLVPDDNFTAQDKDEFLSDSGALFSFAMWVLREKITPFFSGFDAEIKEIDRDHDAAKKKLIARNAVFYKKTLFQAFLHLSEEQVKTMTAQEYLDYCIMYKEVVALLHLPWLKQE